MLLLITRIPHFGEMQAQLPDVLETRIVRAQESGEAGVFGAAEVEGDVAVEGLDGEGVELFVDEADVLEVGGAEDLEAGGYGLLALRVEWGGRWGKLRHGRDGGGGGMAGISSLSTLDP
ncbi:hypothetical protein LTS09_009640 [Friedmanniomyces endolithicus]|nr:hypothetical protein LTS09_009640 [Friedmanniomyces endolithicus]